MRSLDQHQLGTWCRSGSHDFCLTSWLGIASEERGSNCGVSFQATCSINYLLFSIMPFIWPSSPEHSRPANRLQLRLSNAYSPLMSAILTFEIKWVIPTYYSIQIAKVQFERSPVKLSVELKLPRHRAQHESFTSGLSKNRSELVHSKPTMGKSAKVHKRVVRIRIHFISRSRPLASSLGQKIEIQTVYGSHSQRIFQFYSATSTGREEKS